MSTKRPDREAHEIPDELLFRYVAGRLLPGEARRIEEWAQTPENQRRLEDVRDVLQLAQRSNAGLPFHRPPTGQELIAKAERYPARRSHRTAAVLLIGIAAAIFMLVLASLFTRPMVPSMPPTAASFGAEEFSTGSEAANVGLRDGTTVRLAPATRLQVHDRADTRGVTLAGRGFFSVVPNPNSPFIVHTDVATVLVVGTRFDLSVTGDDLRLVVLDGHVKLRVRGVTVDVRPGQLAEVIDGNLVPPVDVPDPEAFVDWIGDFLAFQDTPLATVAREIERRHGVRLVFTDPGLKKRTVTALFAGRSVNEIIEVVCTIAAVSCSRDGAVVTASPD